jgi:hypothetical protein
MLMRRWRARQGEGQLVLIVGEPRIGKSRIVQTMVEQISAEPHTRMRYFCSPHHQYSALYPIITQLERAAGFKRDDVPEQRIDKLEAVLSQATNDLSAVAPPPNGLAVDPNGRTLPFTQSHPAEAEGEDASCADFASRGTGRAPTGVDGVRGRAPLRVSHSICSSIRCRRCGSSPSSPSDQSSHRPGSGARTSAC